MVFQSPEDQIVGMTVEEDVAFGPENLGIAPAEIRRRVNDALETVQMEPFRLRPPHQLSAGQMQRVALAGILAMRPRCIIFDEATSMLDPQGRRDVMDLLLQLNREGLTIIYITHFMEEAAWARRVIALSQGKIVLDGTPERSFLEPGAAGGNWLILAACRSSGWLAAPGAAGAAPGIVDRRRPPVCAAG